MFGVGILAVLLVLASSAVLAKSTSPMDLPFEVVKARLAEMFHCEWQGEGGRFISCQVREIRGDIDLFPRKADGAADGIELYALLADTPRNSRNEHRSLDAVERVAQWLLPGWKGRHLWLRDAIRQAYKRKQSHIHVRNINLWITPPAGHISTFCS
jgi:hypothetical protein